MFLLRSISDGYGSFKGSIGPGVSSKACGTRGVAMSTRLTFSLFGVTL